MLTFTAQTKTHLEEVSKKLFNKNNSLPMPNKITIRRNQSHPNSEWTIVEKSLPTARKSTRQQLNKKPTFPEIKKLKKNSSFLNEKLLNNKNLAEILEASILALIPKAPIPHAFFPEFFFRFSEKFTKKNKEYSEIKIYWLLMAKLLKDKLIPNDLNELGKKIDSLIDSITTSYLELKKVKPRLETYLDTVLSTENLDERLKNLLVNEIAIYCKDLQNFSLSPQSSILQKNNPFRNYSNFTKEFGGLMYLTRNSCRKISQSDENANINYQSTFLRPR